MSLSREIQELLVRVAAGELARDSDELRAALARDPAARSEAEEWLATAGEIEALAREEGPGRAEPTTPEDLELARGFLRAHAARPATPARASGVRRWMLTALLAAAALVGWFVLARDGDTAGERDLFLGGGKLELLEPRGVGDFTVFRWAPLELPELGSYRLVVEGCGTELLRVEGLRAASFRPDELQRARLETCSTVRWTVAALDGSGDGRILAWGSAEASRP